MSGDARTVRTRRAQRENATILCGKMLRIRMVMVVTITLHFLLSGRKDDLNFTANKMCCACRGGARRRLSQGGVTTMWTVVGFLR